MHLQLKNNAKECRFIARFHADLLLFNTVSPARAPLRLILRNYAGVDVHSA